MAAACGIIDSVLEHRDYPESAPWLYGDNIPSNNPSINGLITFFIALITYVALCPFAIELGCHLTSFNTGFKILFLYLFTFPLNLCEHAKLPLYTMTQRWCIKANLPWRVAGIYQMIWVKSNIYSRTKRELWRRYTSSLFKRLIGCWLWQIYLFNRIRWYLKNVQLVERCTTATKCLMKKK